MIFLIFRNFKAAWYPLSGGSIVINWKIIGMKLYLSSLDYFFSQSVKFFIEGNFWMPVVFFLSTGTLMSFIQKVLANINEKKNKICLFNINPSMYLVKLWCIIQPLLPKNVTASIILQLLQHSKIHVESQTKKQFKVLKQNDQVFAVRGTGGRTTNVSDF